MTFGPWASNPESTVVQLQILGLGCKLFLLKEDGGLIPYKQRGSYVKWGGRSGIKWSQPSDRIWRPTLDRGPSEAVRQVSHRSIINVPDSKYPNIDSHPSDPDWTMLIVPTQIGILYLI
jgi:hypothetical protein